MAKKDKEFGRLFAKMGLSRLSELQQAFPLFKSDSYYYMRYKGDNAIIFRQAVRTPKRNKISENSLDNLRKKQYTGILSKKVRAKIIDICSNWIDTINHMNEISQVEPVVKKRVLNMLTLTLSKDQRHDDREIKRKLLMPFIQLLKRKYNLKNYLWRAEKQKNGNIHFHILIDIYIDKSSCQDAWNYIQSSLGYTNYHDWNQGRSMEPSTRIECCTYKDSAVHYVAKYVSKDDCEIPVEGRLWGCNRELKELKTPEYRISQENLVQFVSQSVKGCYTAWHNEQSIVIYRANQSVWINEILSNDILSKRIIKWNVEQLYQQQDLFQNYANIEDWEQDVKNEYNEIMTRYLFENDMFGSIDDFVERYVTMNRYK